MTNVPSRATGEAMSRRDLLAGLAAGCAVIVATPAVASTMTPLILEHRRKFAASEAAITRWDNACAAYLESMKTRPIAVPSYTSCARIEIEGAEAEIRRLRYIREGMSEGVDEEAIRAAEAQLAARDREFRVSELEAEKDAAAAAADEALDRLLRARPKIMEEARLRFAYLIENGILEQILFNLVHTLQP